MFNLTVIMPEAEEAEVMVLIMEQPFTRLVWVAAVAGVKQGRMDPQTAAGAPVHGLALDRKRLVVPAS
jgi:hypothetical protein